MAIASMSVRVGPMDHLPLVRWKLQTSRSEDKTSRFENLVARKVLLIRIVIAWSCDMLVQ